MPGLLNRPSRYGMPWERRELILAFDLYCRIPFQKTKQTNPQVQELAHLLDRSPAGIARKLGNFGAFDPELRRQGITGLGNGSKQDESIWNEFHADWNTLVYESSQIRDTLTAGAEVDLTTTRPSGPSEVQRMTKQRVHQAFFRESVLSSYEGRCCVTGLPVTACLVASHIVPWSNNESLRADPSNGLCLHSLADRLFDVGLMTISHELRVELSSSLLNSRDDAVKRHLLPLHGQPLRMPCRFLPHAHCLEWHRNHVFKINYEWSYYETC